jgi:iron uptake system component EfeO
MRRARALGTALLSATVLTLAACGDDGGEVRDASSTSAASGSGSGSASGIAVDSNAKSDDPKVNEGAAQYTQYVRQQVDQLIGDAKKFTDAVRAGDVAAAKAAFAPSRQAWERIEPIAGLVESIDGAVDARVDDFANEDDPTWTGWHKLEYLLWEKGDIGPSSGAAKLADQLDADLQQLKGTMDTTDIPPAAIPAGAAELIEEVSAGKITGEEDRYSGTDLWDFAANVEGSEKAYELLEPAVKAKNADLDAKIEQGFDDIDAALAKYEDGSGYKPFNTLTAADTDQMKTILAELSENLAQVSGVLGLE